MSSFDNIDDLLRDLLSRFQGVNQTDERQWEALCPIHADNKPSLAIGAPSSTQAVVWCHACGQNDGILTAVGLKTSDLFVSKKPTSKIVAQYDYHDDDGTLIGQVVRFEPGKRGERKSFSQRRRTLNGGWEWKKVPKAVPYRLPELIAADADQIIFICEGEKDCDRLHSLGLIATCNAGGASEGSTKCKWTKNHAKYLAGRKVVIIPDNDKAGRDHANGVALSLHGTASSIKVVTLPNLPEKGDVSDYLNNFGTKESLAELVASTDEWKPSPVQAQPNGTELIIGSEDPGIIKRLADRIIIDDSFARDAGGKLYRYRDGAYRARGEDFIRGRVKRLCIEWEEAKEWTSRLANEVVEFIRVDTPELWTQPPAEVVNVSNGLLRLADCVLLPHTIDHLSTIQLPVAYDPAAACPNIDQFFSDVFPSDAIELAAEIAAIVIAPTTSIQKAVLLIGAGGNGKSTYLSMLVAMIGKGNTAAIALHRLETDRFSGARLIGKLANICADLPSEHLAGTSMFKLLTGGDAIEAERKFCDSFEFTPFARLIFSANSLPRSQDASEGFFDRWLVVPFDARFRGTDREVSRQELDARLSQPSELSGFLNKAVNAWQRIKSTGRLSEPESIREAWREFHATTDPLAVWLDRYTVDDPQASVTKAALRTAYGAACERSGRPPLSDKAFTQQLMKHRQSVAQAQKTINNRVQRCYVGIGLATDSGHDFTASRHSQDTSTCYQRTREENEEDGREDESSNRKKEVRPTRETREAVKYEMPASSSCSHEVRHWRDEPDHHGRPGWVTTVCECGQVIDSREDAEAAAAA